MKFVEIFSKIYFRVDSVYVPLIFCFDTHNAFVLWKRIIVVSFSVSDFRYAYMYLVLPLIS
jgi:hypothetical protein